MERTPLSERVSFLIKNSHLPGDKPFTASSVARKMADFGVEVSESTMIHIANGTTANPSGRIVNAMAKVFRVSPEIFYEEEDKWQADRQYMEQIRQRLDSNSRLAAARSLRRRQRRDARAIAKLNRVTKATD